MRAVTEESGHPGGCAEGQSPRTITTQEAGRGEGPGVGTEKELPGRLRKTQSTRPKSQEESASHKVGGVLALILRKPGKLGLVFWKRELSGSGRGTRFHSEEWMDGWEVKNRKQ